MIWALYLRPPIRIILFTACTGLKPVSAGPSFIATDRGIIRFTCGVIKLSAIMNLYQISWIVFNDRRVRRWVVYLLSNRFITQADTSACLIPPQRTKRNGLVHQTKRLSGKLRLDVTRFQKTDQPESPNRWHFRVGMTIFLSCYERENK